MRSPHKLKRHLMQSNCFMKISIWAEEREKAGKWHLQYCVWSSGAITLVEVWICAFLLTLVFQTRWIRFDNILGVASTDFKLDTEAVQCHSHQGCLLNFSQGCLLLHPHCKSQSKTVKFKLFNEPVLLLSSSLPLFSSFKPSGREPLQSSTH